MHVRIDEARHHPKSAGLDNLRIRGNAEAPVPLDGFDYFSPDEDVRDFVHLARRVDEPPAPQQYSAHPTFSPSLSESTIE